MGQPTLLQSQTSYVNDELLAQGGPSTNHNRAQLQQRLDERVEPARNLNTKYRSDKSELMHMIPATREMNHNIPADSIILYNKTVATHKSIKTLGVIIDYRASFRILTATKAGKAGKSMGIVFKVSIIRRISPGAIHYLITTTTLPAMLWRSEA